MPLYNLDVKLTMTVVVLAEDEGDARDVAEQNWKEYLSDCPRDPLFNVTGEVTRSSHLRDGWCDGCHPYGGDKPIRELLAEAAKTTPED